MGIDNNKPSWIKDAVYHEDSERLSAAGKKGAEALKKKREKAADEAEILEMMAEEKKVAEEVELRESTNENVIPVD